MGRLNLKLGSLVLATSGPYQGKLGIITCVRDLFTVDVLWEHGDYQDYVSTNFLAIVQNEV